MTEGLLVQILENFSSNVFKVNNVCCVLPGVGAKAAVSPPGRQVQPGPDSGVFAAPPPGGSSSSCSSSRCVSHSRLSAAV